MNRGTSLSARRMARILKMYWRRGRFKNRTLRWWPVISWGRWDDHTLQFVEQRCVDARDFIGARMARLFLLCSPTQRMKAEKIAFATGLRYPD